MFYLDKNQVTACYVIEDIGDKVIIVPKNQVMTVPKKAMFSDKKIAMYELFKKRRREGVPLKNFTRSKYFKYYCEKAKKEDPELLF